MFHEFSFGGWGSLPLFVGISIPRQSKLSESKQLWDWPGLVMEPPSKKAQIPFLRAPLCDQCLMIQKETGGFTQNDADVCWEKNATNIYIFIYIYIYIYYNTGGRVSPRIGMSFHCLKHHAVVFALWPARQRWVPLWKLQSWHFGGIPALQWYYESKLQVHPINPPC